MFRRFLGRERPSPATEYVALDLDTESTEVLQEFVETIVQELDFWAAMLAVVEEVEGKTRLTVKAFTTAFDRQAEGLLRVGDFVGRSLLEVGQLVAGQNLIGNYVLVDAETAKVNKAVRAILEEEPYAIVDDLYSLFAPRVKPEIAKRLQSLARVKKIITVPFRNRQGKVIGNLYAASENLNITDEKIRQVRAFSRLATTMLENSALRYERMRMTQRESVLKETITELLSETLSEQGLLQNITDSVVNKLGFRACMLSIVRYRDGKAILPVVAYQFAPELMEMIEIGEHYANLRLRGAWVAVDEETATNNIAVQTILQNLSYAKTQHLSDLFSPVVPERIAGVLQTMFGIQMLATVPLRDKRNDRDELRGNLFAATERDDISPAEIEDLKTFALAASIAIENAQHMRETQRMGLLASNVGHITHHFNNILGGVRWEVEALKKVAQNPRSTNEAILQGLDQTNEQIKDSIDKIKGLQRHFSDHLDNSQQDESIFDVNAELERVSHEIQTVYRKVYSKQVRVQTYYSLEKPFVLATAELGEVFGILMKNAYEAMPDGGNLTLSTEIVAGNRKTPERSVLIKISDTGNGIPPNQYGELFKLKQSSAKQGGMGYGLWSAKLTVEWFSGRIRFESLTQHDIDTKPGLSGREKGTTFILRFPMVDIEGRRR